MVTNLLRRHAEHASDADTELMFDIFDRAARQRGLTAQHFDCSANLE